MKLELNGGFYAAKSIIANAQRCVNLYPERNEADAPFPFTTYPTPGLTLLGNADQPGCRCLYRASTGDLYGVFGAVVYAIDSGFNCTALGSIAPGSGIVSMADNRLVILIVDGTDDGYYIDLATQIFGQIRTPAFYGGDLVSYIDTFFALNQHDTANFYLSASELNVALITGGPVTGGTFTGGSGYTSGDHGSVPLTGGSGVGQTADITVVAGIVTIVTLDSTQVSVPYQVGDVLTADPGSLGGAITGSAVIGGAAYTAGTYAGTALTGGSGTGAIATIVVLAGIVTTATITTAGLGYKVGDVLSAPTSAIGGTGSGFLLNITTVAAAGTGFSYTVTSVGAGELGFDSLDIAAKSGASDTLVAAPVIHDEIWLIGQQTSEVWTASGLPDFAFQKLSGIFMQHGCVAKYSIAQADLSMFWLGQDPQGNCIVFRGAEYTAQRVSTHAIENAIQKYSVVSDAVGFTYQIEGHVFYVLTFPSADKTWAYDMATKMWHEWVWTDGNGLEHRHRAQCAAFAYGMNIVGDWETGALYQLDVDAATDDGNPIVRRRSFPQLVNEAKRLSYDRFVAEMDVGTVAVEDVSPVVYLRVSFTKGATYGNPIEIPIGATGDYSRSLQRRQIGMGRDTVFELFWSGDFATALNGAYVDATAAET